MGVKSLSKTAISCSISATKYLGRKFKLLGLSLLLVGALVNLGSRLGLWSTPSKKGLLPYEAPSLRSLEDLIVNDAFAT